MTNSHFEYEELEDKDFAINFLGDELIKGNLLLFLGAGTSFDFGLPSWEKLVNEMRNEVGLSPIAGKDLSTVELQNAADEVIDTLDNNDELISLISKVLYKDGSVKLDISHASTNKLIIALSSLIIGSRRGHVKRVISLNYDSMLEWFLSCYGYLVKTVVNLPSFEGLEDVRIYHPHGYVPHPEFSDEKSNEIILGLSSANMRLATSGDPWFELVRHQLNCSTNLFLGMSINSLEDRAIGPLFTKCGNDSKGIRPLGIWISYDELSETNMKAFRRNNIAAIELNTVDKICEFLFAICQNAMNKFRKNLTF